MARLRRITFVVLVGVGLATSTAQAVYTNPYAQWSNGPSTDPGYFPLAVWLQDASSSATQWKAANVNLFVGQWQGPTTAQLDALQAADMPAIVEMNGNAVDAASRTLSDGSPLVVGWMQQDEPDNAQWTGSAWGPPVPTSTIQNVYANIKAFDTTRPVYLGLSQGLGWDSQTWIGQGGNIVPSVHYPAYLAGTDIMSMDIYPMDCARSQVCGDAWRPAKGVDGLYQYGGPNKTAWNALETGDVAANGLKATVDEMRMEAWSSIIHGSKGIIWFIHGKSNTKNFDHQALLRPENAAHLAGFTTLNAEILSLASVINSESFNSEVIVQSSNAGVPVDTMVKHHNGLTYLFATGMRDNATTATFSFAGLGDGTVEVINEDRSLAMTGGQFSDPFGGFDTHLYRIVIAGDFNADGTVDAADYTVWRDGLGAIYTLADYNDWASNFGSTSVAVSTSVPEPSAWLLSAFIFGGRFRGEKTTDRPDY